MSPMPQVHSVGSLQTSTNIYKHLQMMCRSGRLKRIRPEDFTEALTVTVEKIGYFEHSSMPMYSTTFVMFFLNWFLADLSEPPSPLRLERWMPSGTLLITVLPVEMM